MVDQQVVTEIVLTPEQQAQKILNEMLAEVASMFPVTDADYELVGYGRSAYFMRFAEGKGRNQISAVRTVFDRLRIGSHSEAEEQEAKADPDLQFVDSWEDALSNINSRRPGPERITHIATQRWVEGGKDKLILLPPNSVARQQYIQFAPGMLLSVILNGQLAKLPIECFNPWEYFSRPLPLVLEKQYTSWPNREEVAECIKKMILKVSKLFPLTERDHALINMAKAEIQSRFVYGFWQLVSAFVTDHGHMKVTPRGDDDDLSIGVQHDTKSGRANLDAEQAAIKKDRRLFPGELIDTLVTAHRSTRNHNHGEEVNLVSSCALCRKSLLHHNPNIKMLIPLNGEGIGKVPGLVLYPLPDFPVPGLLPMAA